MPWLQNLAMYAHAYTFYVWTVGVLVLRYVHMPTWFVANRLHTTIRAQAIHLSLLNTEQHLTAFLMSWSFILAAKTTQGCDQWLHFLPWLLTLIVFWVTVWSIFLKYENFQKYSFCVSLCSEMMKNGPQGPKRFELPKVLKDSKNIRTASKSSEQHNGKLTFMLLLAVLQILCVQQSTEMLMLLAPVRS